MVTAILAASTAVVFHPKYAHCPVENWYSNSCASLSLVLGEKFLARSAGTAVIIEEFSDTVEISPGLSCTKYKFGIEFDHF